MSQRNWRPLTLARRAKTSILHSFCLSFNMPSLSPSLVPGPAPALRAATILLMGWGGHREAPNPALGVVRAGFLEEVAANSLEGE